MRIKTAKLRRRKNNNNAHNPQAGKIILDFQFLKSVCIATQVLARAGNCSGPVGRMDSARVEHDTYNSDAFCARTNSICFGHIKMFLVGLGFGFRVFSLAGLIYWVGGFSRDWCPKRSNSN